MTMYKTTANPIGKVKINLGPIMAQQGLSIKDVARLSGMSYMGVYNILNGTTAGVRFDVLAALVEGLGYSLSEIISYEL